MVHMKVHVSIKDRDHFFQQMNQTRSPLFSASRAYDKEPIYCVIGKTDVGELSLIFLKPLIYGLYLRVDALTGIDHG